MNEITANSRNHTRIPFKNSESKVEVKHDEENKEKVQNVSRLPTLKSLAEANQMLQKLLNL